MSLVPDPLSSLDDLTRSNDVRPAWYLDLVLPEIGGGKMAVGDLGLIDETPQATALRVSGLDQQTFEALVTRFGAQFSGLYFWKCPRISDLSPMENLSNLRYVAFYWNQRAVRLWDLAKTPKLKGLQFDDFTRVHTLDDLATAVSLEELAFGDQVWVKATFESLEPLTHLQDLQKLSFAVRRIDDARVQPLATLRRLEVFECPTNLFTTEQLAWLRAHLPDSTEGRVLLPVQKFTKPLVSGKDVLVMGKRKPWLNSSADAKRIQRYVENFERLVERFQADPELEPKGSRT